jgi:hypothetical protein
MGARLARLAYHAESANVDQIAEAENFAGAGMCCIFRLSCDMLAKPGQTIT